MLAHEVEQRLEVGAVVAHGEVGETALGAQVLLEAVHDVAPFVLVHGARVAWEGCGHLGV